MAETQRNAGKTHREQRRSIILGGAGAALVLGAFLALAVALAAGDGSTPTTSRGASGASASEPTHAAASDGPALAVVVRTAQNLRRPTDVIPLVDRLLARNVTRVWVQVKQDDSDEFPSGTALYPSEIAPVAADHGDGRVGEFIARLADGGIQPVAWLPVLHDAQAAAAHPQWRSQRITSDGSLEAEPDWLCPFNPEVAEYQASIAREVVALYPDLEGLFLDFIRYDGDYSCATPEALHELDARVSWSETRGRPLTPMDIREAGVAHSALWEAWTSLRAEKIVDTVNVIRDAVEEVRPDFHIGAFVLPFSTEAYEQNTQAGQDLERLARAGLDEVMLMGYWDDWDQSPAWLREGLDNAASLVGDEADLTVVLDGDMGVRRTRLTLEALGPLAEQASWFNFGPWTEHEFTRLTRAINGHRDQGPMPRPEYVSVVVRIDTEPDSQPSYDAVRPEMIDTIVGLLAEESVPATFITVGKLAERQPEAVQRAAAAGHEIGSHSYDHDQLDGLPVEDQLDSVDWGLAALGGLGVEVRGFGAARNSITDESRDRLMHWDLEYDGSAAYDPMSSLLDVHYQAHSAGGDSRIVVVPFVIPNDFDARFVAELSGEEMLDAWKERLDRVVESGEPVFVLDVHQWLISQPENLAALRAFIQYAKECAACRIETLRDAARHARTILDRYELPATTSGDVTVGVAPYGGSAAAGTRR